MQDRQNQMPRERTSPGAVLQKSIKLCVLTTHGTGCQQGLWAAIIFPSPQPRTVKSCRNHSIVPVCTLMAPGHLLIRLFQFTFVAVSDESPVGRSKFKEFTDQSTLPATKVYIWPLPRFAVRPEHLAFDA